MRVIPPATSSTTGAVAGMKMFDGDTGLPNVDSYGTFAVNPQEGTTIPDALGPAGPGRC
jgi:hypothetical protein